MLINDAVAESVRRPPAKRRPSVKGCEGSNPSSVAFGGIMFYWRVRAGIKNPDIDMDVIPESIVALIKAEDANEAIIKMIEAFPQFDLFITCVELPEH